MNKFFEKQNLPKLTKEEIENLSCCTSITEFEFIIKKTLYKEKSRTSLVTSINI